MNSTPIPSARPGFPDLERRREGAETVEHAEIDVMALDEIEVWRSGTATDGDVGDRRTLVSKWTGPDL